MNPYSLYIDDCHTFLVKQGSIRATVFVKDTSNSSVDAITELDDLDFFKDAESLVRQVSWWAQGVSCIVIYRKDEKAPDDISSDGITYAYL